MSRRPLVPSASSGLDKFKIEVAKDMAVENYYNNNEYKGDYTTKTVGKMATAGNVGGEMVKRMIASVEQQMANKTD